MHKAPTAASARKRIRALGDPNDALFLQRFFKTGPGEYGEGDRFLGIRVPVVRRLATELGELPLEEIEVLLHDRCARDAAHDAALRDREAAAGRSATLHEKGRLVFSQRFHGIQARGAQRRQACGPQSDSDQGQRRQ